MDASVCLSSLSWSTLLTGNAQTARECAQQVDVDDVDGAPPDEAEPEQSARVYAGGRDGGRLGAGYDCTT
jgi:hypothetical protein